jgi:hypothetical protein
VGEVLVKINFPFFAMPNDARAGYYYGVLRYEERNNKLSLVLDTGACFDAIYAFFGSPDSIAIESLRTLIRERLKTYASQTNVIAVEHYIIEARTSRHVPVHIFVAYEDAEINDEKEAFLNYMRGTPSDGVNEEYHFFIISCNEYCVKGRRTSENSKNLRIVRSILVKRGGRINDVNVEDSESVRLSEIKTRPLIVRMPLRTIMTDTKAAINCVKMDLLEVIMGSTIFMKRKGRQQLLQLPVLFPTPLLSALFHRRLREEKVLKKETCDVVKPTDLLVLPSVSYIDVGGMVIKMNLDNLYNSVFWYLIKKLNSARKLLEELFPERPLRNIRIPYYMEQPDIEIHELDIYGEAILKALVNNLVFARMRGLIEGLLEDDVSRLSSEVKAPHRIRRIDIPVSVEGLGLHKLGVDVKREVCVAYETVRKREEYLRAFLRCFRELKERALNNRDITQLLLASLMVFLDKRVGELYMNKKSVKLSKSIPSLKPERLAHRMTLILLELGLHGISHLLLKYVFGLTKLHRKRLRELVVLCVGKNNISRGAVSQHYWDVIVNGFIYKLTSTTDVNTGIIMISDCRPYGYNMWKSIFESFGGHDFMDDFIDFSLKQLGEDKDDDKCLRLWQNEAERLEARMRLYDSSVTLEAERLLNDLFGLGDPSHGDLALPLLDVRPLLQRDVIPLIAKEIGKSECEVKQILKPHMEALYAMSVPFCFDGCYNCVVLDKGCNSNLLSKEWSVSKSMARLILQALKEGDIGE